MALKDWKFCGVNMHPGDWETAEQLRRKLMLRSRSETIRYVLREAAERRGIAVEPVEEPKAAAPSA